MPSHGVGRVRIRWPWSSAVATFIDSSGIAALVRAREAATEAGVAFMVHNPSLALRRPVQLFGMDDLLGAD